VLVALYPALQGAISIHPGHLQQAQKGLECGRFGLCKGVVGVCNVCVVQRLTCWSWLSCTFRVGSGQLVDTLGG